LYLRDEGISGEVLKQEGKCAACIIYIIENTWDTAPVACRSFTARAAGTSSVFF